MDTQDHPGKGLSLSHLIFALNEELKRSVYSPLYVAKYHREARPAGVLQEDSTLTRSIASRPTRFLNLTLGVRSFGSIREVRSRESHSR